MVRHCSGWFLTTAGWLLLALICHAQSPGLGSCPPAAPTPACAPAPSDGPTFELDASFLLWWTEGQSTPPLMTGSAIPGDLGVLGAGTTTLIGGTLSQSPLLGGRFSARAFLAEGLGVEARGLYLESQAKTWTAEGTPVIAIPFLDPTNGAEAALRLQAPQAATGSAWVRVNRQKLWGTELNAIYRISSRDQIEFDLLGGFRQLQLREGLALNTSTTLATPGFFVGQVTPSGSTYLGTDSFSTTNSFYGGQLGGRCRKVLDCFVIEASASVALGTMQQQLNIAGSTQLVAPGLPGQTAPGSLFSQTTNIGSYRRNGFGVIPQAGMQVGWHVTDWACFLAGYDFLYVQDVIRPGDQINRRVNLNLAPIADIGVPGGPAQPAPELSSGSFWAQGLTFSLLFSF
ncbi:MAG: BBP7 family outer membrane beta-barrel protein [Gemmataceae bacterium]